MGAEGAKHLAEARAVNSTLAKLVYAAARPNPTLSPPYVRPVAPSE